MEEGRGRGPYGAGAKGTPGLPSNAKVTQGHRDSGRGLGLGKIDCSENGPDADLEEKAQLEYPAQLDKVILQVKDWEPSTHRWGRTNYVYTAEESKKRRPTASKHSMRDNYNEARKFCNNTILPLYYKKHGKDGTPPSLARTKRSCWRRCKKNLGWVLRVMNRWLKSHKCAV